MPERIQKPTVLVLKTWHECVLGVYTGFQALKAGVDYWVKYHAEEEARLRAKGDKKKLVQTLFWVQFELDYSPEPVNMDFAYIHPPEYDEVRRCAVRNGMDRDQFKVNGDCCRDRAGNNLIWEIVHWDNNPDENVLAYVGMGKRIRGINSLR